MKKDEFKEFVRKNPHLISFVKSNEMTWQKFYEMYDLYGEDNKVWKDYIGNSSNNNVEEKIATSALTGFSFAEILSWLKSIDLDGLQQGIGNLQRVLGVVQDLSKKDTKEPEKPVYKPRPLYKHFED